MYAEGRAVGGCVSLEEPVGRSTLDMLFCVAAESCARMAGWVMTKLLGRRAIHCTRGALQFPWDRVRRNVCWRVCSVPVLLMLMLMAKL